MKTNTKLNQDSTYYVRYSNHIDEDLKRGWSSWNFGLEGFNGTEQELQDAINQITDTSPFWISGFDIYPDFVEEYEIKELYPNYWVVVDNINAKNGLSGHELPKGLLTIDDILNEVKANRHKYDGTGDGETICVEEAKVIYSDGDMHIIQVY